MTKLFISYSSKDSDVADRVWNHLVEFGYESPFRDCHPDAGIAVGDSWEQEIYRKIKLCRGLIVLVSKQWADSKWCFAELICAKAQGKELFPVILDEQIQLPSILAEKQAVSFSDPDFCQRLKNGLKRMGLAPENDFPWPVEGVDRCPFPGLQPFESHHAGIFFGREPEILQLLERLNQMAASDFPRMLFILGASGSGKSSLVKAGILPRLSRKSADRWLVFEGLRWADFRSRGRTWEEQLAIIISQRTPEALPHTDWKQLRDRYRVGPSDPNAHLKEAAGRFIEDTKDLLFALGSVNSTPLLFIDQFEEILSCSIDDQSANVFLKFLGELMSAANSPWRCIATVRSDFLPEIQSNDTLIEWKDAVEMYSLPLLDPRRFYDVIRFPAEKMGVSFESDALIDQIVSDTCTNDALPLLSFTLRELYQRFGNDNVLTRDEYEKELGGLEGCLSQVADELLKDSSDELTGQLQQVFSNYLVRINENDAFTRRLARWSELPPSVRPTLEKFIDRRLITTTSTADEDSSERVIEVAHESLFRTWGQLNDWLTDRRDLIRWRTEVERDQTAYGERWNGITQRQYAVARDLQTRMGDEFLDKERRWVANAAKKNRRRWMMLVSATVVFALVAVAAYMFARESNRQTTLANDKKKEALTLAALGSLRNGGVALKYDEEILAANLWYANALKIVEDASEDVRYAARSLIGGWSDELPLFSIIHDGKIRSVTFSPDGRWIATGSEDHTARIWDALTGEPVTEPLLHKDPVFRVVFSPDSKLLATASGSLQWDYFKNEAKLFVVPAGNQVGETMTHPKRIYDMTFSPDGRWLATGCEDHFARLWNTDNATLRGKIEHERAVGSLAFRPDGKVFATGMHAVTTYDTSRSKIQQWDTKTLEKHGEAIPSSDDITSLKFDSTGNRIAGNAQIWDLSQNPVLGRELLKEAGFDHAFTVDFPRVENVFLITGEKNKSGILQAFGFDAANKGRPLWNSPIQHGSRVTSFDLTGDNQLLATAGDDGFVHLWEFEAGYGEKAPVQLSKRCLEVARLPRHRDRVNIVSFDPQGQRLLTASDDYTVRVWKVNRVPRKRFSFPMEKVDPVDFLSFSRDGSRLAVGASSISPKSGESACWNMETGTRIGKSFYHTEELRMVRMSPDGKYFATVGRDNTARLWDAATGKQIGSPLVHDGNVLAVDFSPDSKTIVTGAGNNVEYTDGARLWSTSTGKETGKRMLHHSAVNVVRFSPDGTMVATGSHDQSVRVWNARTCEPLFEPLKHTGTITKIEFSPDSKSVYTISSYDGTLKHWSTSDGKPLVSPDNRDTHFSNFALSPDGRLIATVEGRTIRFWERASGNPVTSPFQVEDSKGDRIEDLEFSPNGKVLAFAASAARLMDPISGQPFGSSRRRHSIQVKSVAFSPNGRYLATGGWTKTVSIWDLNPPALDSPERVWLSMQVRTGMTIEYGAIRKLTQSQWLALKQELKKTGGDCLDRTWDDLSDQEQRSSGFAAATESQ